MQRQQHLLVVEEDAADGVLMCTGSADCTAIIWLVIVVCCVVDAGFILSALLLARDTLSGDKVAVLGDDSDMKDGHCLLYAFTRRRFAQDTLMPCNVLRSRRCRLCCSHLGGTCDGRMASWWLLAALIRRFESGTSSMTSSCADIVVCCFVSAGLSRAVAWAAWCFRSNRSTSFSLWRGIQMVEALP